MIALLWMGVPALAQWETQTIPLQPGWNAIHLRVQPAVNHCADLFDGTAVESVHWWRRESVSEEFDLDPDVLFARRADWDAWFAGDPDLSSFGRLLAGETYLVKVADGAPAFNLAITGRVVLNPINWMPGELNLVGLPAAAQTTLGQFFYFTPDITVRSTTENAFRIGSDGQPQRVFEPWSTAINSGEAYWIRTGPNVRTYDGPIRLALTTGIRMLDFGQSLTPRAVLIENLTDADRTIRIEHLPSQTPPEGWPELLGRPRLLYRFDGGEPYAPLPSVLVTNLPAGQTRRLLLAPDASAMASQTSPDAAWQGILEVTDGDNDEYEVATVRHRLGIVCDGLIGTMAHPAGLWVGEAVIEGVNRAPTRPDTTPPWDSTTPLPVAEPFRFRLILHVDADGVTRLLSRALVAWRPADDTPEDVAAPLVAGHVELLADEIVARAYQQRYPEARIRRIGTINLPPRAPIVMDGDFGGEGVLNGAISIPYDDPVNPFVHRFHPDHDNREIRNNVEIELPEGVESFTVIRDWLLTFAPLDPEQGADNRLWGAHEAGGVFEEQIQGLNKTLRSRGRFRLERVSENGVLIEELL